MRTARRVGLVLSLQSSVALFAQIGQYPGLQLDTGKQIFQAGCVACHGTDGKGTPKTIAGFDPPDTFPDFTRCDQTTPEPDNAWRSVIRDGGPSRGFSQIMPSFSEALTPAQIDKVVAYLRGFCKEPQWPRGELNLPRPMVTDKAFPESEVVISAVVNARGAPAVTNQYTYEWRLSARNQIELAVPFTFQHQNTGSWLGGVGDIAVALKRNLYSSVKKGSIFSVQGEVLLPTGNVARGLGSGVTIFEGFGAFAQLLPGNSFLQFQAGAEFPTHTPDAARAVFWRTVLGKTFYENRGLGRMWSPMIEFLAAHDFNSAAKTNWDVVPQMQVTLSRRQHVRASAGFLLPVNNTAGRSSQVMFYLLWDFADGKLLEGWR